MGSLGFDHKSSPTRGWAFVPTELYFLLPVMRINLQVLAGRWDDFCSCWSRVYLYTRELNQRSSIYDQRKISLHHFCHWFQKPGIRVSHLFRGILLLLLLLLVILIHTWQEIETPSVYSGPQFVVESRGALVIGSIHVLILLLLIGKHWRQPLVRGMIVLLLLKLSVPGLTPHFPSAAFSNSA